MSNLENIKTRTNYANTEVIDIIQCIRDTPGKNDKVAILKVAINTNPNFKSAIVATYDKFYIYGIKNIFTSLPKFKTLKIGTSKLALFYFCDRFLMKTLATGNSDHQMKAKMSMAIERLSNVEAEVVPLILARSFDAGFSVASINKAVPGTIPEFPVQKCQKFNEKTILKIKYPAIAQLKEDGLRCVVIVKSGNVSVKTGNAKPIYEHGALTADALAISNGEDIVLDGELIFFKDDERLPRTTSNGLGNKAIKKTLTLEESKGARFIAWDIIPFEDFIKASSEIKYDIRIARLSNHIVNLKTIKLIEQITVDSYLEAHQYYLSMLLLGFEGIILKNTSALWNSKRSSDLLKFKVEDPADLRILEVVEGAGKYNGMLGAFVCESECGIVNVTVGSGLTDSQRTEYFTNSMIGKIIEVKYNEIISNKVNKNTRSLFLPIFQSVRLDKTKANTLQELL